MKIVICGSMAFYKGFKDLKNQLDAMGHSTVIPQLRVEMTEGNISIRDYLETKAQPGDDLTWLWKKKNSAILDHFKETEDSDCILVANYKKNELLVILELIRC